MLGRLGWFEVVWVMLIGLVGDGVWDVDLVGDGACWKDVRYYDICVEGGLRIRFWPTTHVYEYIP